MKFAYEFEQLCGSVYSQGNIVFAPDGNSLLSAVGNRIMHFDLINHKTKTYAFEARADITTLAISHDSRLLIAVDQDGRSLLVNLKRGVVLYRFHFKKPVKTLVFSPNDAFFCVSHGKQVQVWHTPGLVREFAPFVLYRTYTGHHDDVVSLSWSPDSCFFLSGSKDLTARLYSIDSYNSSFHAMSLAGHRETVVGAFFTSHDNTEIITVGKDGAAFVWKCARKEDGRFQETPSEGDTSGEDDRTTDQEQELITPRPFIAQDNVQWSTTLKHVFKMDYAKVTCVTHHLALSLLVVGFSNGTFGLYESSSETGDLQNIHTLSISQNKINTVSMNVSGDWLAFASETLGQLLVWEWKSETYVLKQQGHYFDLNVLDYSPDGAILATGGDDSKMKLWSATSGFCFVTFTDHTASVTGVCFTSNGSAVLSASLDGTVRAYDLERYKNFRTLTTPSPVQFISLAMDPSGQIVCAGTLDPFQIYTWSLQTGRLTDVFSGHEGPITSLAFSPQGSGKLVLASASWDHTVRLWDVTKAKALIEPLEHTHDVLALAFRPDGAHVVTATLNGMLTIWDVAEGQIIGTIDGRRDISGGRKQDDRMTASSSALSKYFTSVCYSSDGTCILAGGESKFVCIYEASQQLLVKKYQISHNRSLDGVLDKLNSRLMTEAGPIRENELMLNDAEEDATTSREMDQLKLLGAKRCVDPGNRRAKLAIRSKAVKFSPTGASWAAASTDGLLIYSLNENMLFDPIDLDESITPVAIHEALANDDYARALLMALHLNEESLLRAVVESRVSAETIDLIVQGLAGASKFLSRLMFFLAKRLETSPHVEFYLLWIRSLLTCHGAALNRPTGTEAAVGRCEFLSAFRALQKAMMMHLTDLSSLCNDTQYSLDYLHQLGTFAAAAPSEPLLLAEVATLPTIPVE